MPLSIREFLARVTYSRASISEQLWEFSLSERERERDRELARFDRTLEKPCPLEMSLSLVTCGAVWVRKTSVNSDVAIVKTALPPKFSQGPLIDSEANSRNQQMFIEQSYHPDPVNGPLLTQKPKNQHCRPSLLLTHKQHYHPNLVKVCYWLRS